MKKRNIVLTATTIICVSLFVVSCSCLPLLPGSRLYQPYSDWEKGEYNKANRSIYPGDVREDITKYQSITIAWTGIIKDTKIYQTDEGIDIIFLLEHHYYDWIEDFSPRRERIFLSPRGEGLFMTKWSLVKETPQSKIEEWTEPGRLLIVYGAPAAVRDDDTIAVKSSYVRNIGKEYYTTEILDYGRLGEGPSKIIAPSKTDK